MANSTSLPTATVLFVRGPTASWLEERLLNAGHGVLEASTLGEALAKIAAEDPDLVVIESDLPGQDARALCETLALNSDNERPLVIETTADLAPEERIGWLRSGAWDCLIPSSERVREESLLRIEWFMRARRATARDRLGMLTDPHTGLYNRLGLSRRARELGAQSFRNRESVTCIVFELVIDPDSEGAMASCARGMQDEGRLSDVIARLSEREIAVLATHTDEAGALKLADRMAHAIRAHLALTEGEATRVEVHAAWDSVPSLGYTPVQPIDLVIRAAAAARVRSSAGEEAWIRRSGAHAQPVAVQRPSTALAP